MLSRKITGQPYFSRLGRRKTWIAISQFVFAAVLEWGQFFYRNLFFAILQKFSRKFVKNMFAPVLDYIVFYV